MTLTRRDFIRSAMALPLVPEALVPLVSEDQVPVTDSQWQALHNDPITFSVRTDGVIELPYDVGPKTRWDAYYLWSEGELPTRADLKALPARGRYEIYRYWIDFRDLVRKAIESAEQYVEGNDPTGGVMDGDDRWFDAYLPYADILGWPASDDWDQLTIFLDRLTDHHFADLAERMKAWADSDEFGPEEWEEFEVAADGQDFAFRFFYNDPDWYEPIGVKVIEGVRPGSNYYAAELRLDVDEANRRALEADVPVRFIAAGEHEA